MTSSAQRGSMTVLAIDPGSEHSAWVLWDGTSVLRHGKDLNADVLGMLYEGQAAFLADALVIEEIASYGMPVGREVFQTVRWCGRFEECGGCVGLFTSFLPRRDVKLHLCGQARAKDANIRHAVLDKFGGKEKAIGCKARPGPLFGIKGDCWQALALAITWMETRECKKSGAL